MKKSTLFIAVLLLCATSLFAQAPEKFTYQAVVRNANNSLVTNVQVGVRVNILQGTASGTTVYSESHIASTNTNGLVTVSIGAGSVLYGSFTGIDWSNGPYFLKTDIDPNGGNDYTITSVQQLLSVPYALYAKEAANAFSGDYNDLTNTPQIPTVPTNVSAFTNDAGYITAAQVPAQVNADWNATSGAAEILNKPNLFSGNYNDLTNKPTIPTVPANVSSFNNDAGYITSAQVPAQVNADWNATSGAAQILNKPTLFSGNYNDLTNKPTLFDGNYNSLTNRPNLAAVAISGSYNDLINKPAIPTAVGELTNNVGYITQAQVPAQVNADWNATSGAAQILNKPTLFSGNYNDLTNKPTLFSGNYNDLTNKPVIPTIPTNVSAFTNDAGYITENDLTGITTVPTNVSAFTNDAGYLTSYTETDPQFNAWNKDYNDLTNKPTIPTVPTNVSAFTNDAGYLTSFTEQQVLSISHDTLFLTGGSFVKLPAGFDGDYNSLTNKPTIPTVPANVSVFTNDAHYITEAQLNTLLISIDNTIDSLRNRIEDLENVEPQINQDTVNTDTTIYFPVYVDGLACPGVATVTDWDGNLYNTVAIGQQCWLKENLRSTHYADGTAISSFDGNSSSTIPYYYANNSIDASVYGYLYNWPAVMCGMYSSSTNPSNVRGICPYGWHVPSDAEWSQLTQYVSSQQQYLCGISGTGYGKALASNIGWDSNTGSCAVGNGPNSNNATGFSAVPAGLYHGGHYHIGRYADFWSATQSTAACVWDRLLDSYGSAMSRYQPSKSDGLSVRCLRD